MLCFLYKGVTFLAFSDTKSYFPSVVFGRRFFLETEKSSLHPWFYCAQSKSRLASRSSRTVKIIWSSCVLDLPSFCYISFSMNKEMLRFLTRLVLTPRFFQRLTHNDQILSTHYKMPCGEQFTGEIIFGMRPVQVMFSWYCDGLFSIWAVSEVDGCRSK
jgi:hypothetical protein